LGAHTIAYQPAFQVNLNPIAGAVGCQGFFFSGLFLLQFGFAPRQAFAHTFDNFPWRSGFKQVIMHAVTQGLHGGFHRAISRQQDDFSIGRKLSSNLHYIQAVHTWHFQVEQNQVNSIIAQVFYRQLAVGGHRHMIAFQPQNIA